MAVIKNNYLVKKRNILNELRSSSMTLQELRFFSIYLSKINPNNPNTRVVRFSIDDFKAIMELGRINIDYMKTVTNSLLSKVVNIPTERGGYTGFQLFKECTVDIDEKSEWYIEIDVHDKALPLMFEFKDKFFSYQLWNALRLKSPNQLRMYEILKQYEKIGCRILSVEELRNLLGLNKNEYSRFGDFRKWVLDACQQALYENTDLQFIYEPHGKRGKGGKILYIKFIINKNNDFTDQLTLSEFIEQKKVNDNEKLNKYEDRIQFLMDACDNEFCESEIIVLYDLMKEILSSIDISDDIICYNYLMGKYNEMKMRNEKNKIIHRFSYLKSLINKI